MQPSKLKEWEIVGDAKSSLSCGNKMGFEISVAQNKTMTKFSISYLTPKE